MAQTLVSTIGGVPGTGAITSVTGGTVTVSNPTALIFTGASVSASGSAALVAVTGGSASGGTVNTVIAGATTVSNPATLHFVGATIAASGTEAVVTVTSSSGSGGIPYGNISGPPASAGFSWVNQGSCTVAQAGGTGTPIMLTMPSDVSLNWRGRFINQPSTPYTLYALMTYDGFLTPSTSTAMVMGLYFYDGTKLMGIEFVSISSVGMLPAPVLRVEKITNVTSDGSTAASRPTSASLVIAPQTMGFLYVRLKNDGSTLTFSYSLDGYNWVDLFSESVGTYITPTQIGFGGLNLSSPNTLDQHISLLSWLTA